MEFSECLSARCTAEIALYGMSVPVMSRLVCGLAVLFICSLRVLAQSPDPGEHEQWGTKPFELAADQMVRNAERIALPESGDVEYLLEETVVHIEADGRHCEETRTIYRILSEAGIETCGSVSCEWSPWHQDRPLLQARVINDANDAVELAPHEVVEGSPQQEEGIYSDRRSLQAPLPAVRVGSLVETYSKTTDSRPAFAAGTVDARYFNRLDHTALLRLTIDIADSVPFQFRKFGPGLTFTESRADNRKVFVWETAESLGIGDFEATPPSDIIQGTMVAYSNAESWTSVVQAYSELIGSRLNSEALESQVAKILDGEQDTTRKIERLLTFVQQQVRYTGLLFGDGSIVPTNPDETLRRRYGDCKDQSALLIALLRTAGIEANPVLIKSSLGRDALSELPGLGAFNHMIVHVGGKQEYWVDPTATTTPLGELPVTDQNRQCLIIRSGETSLRRSPGSVAADNGVLRVREIHVVDQGESTIKETTTYLGTLAAMLRQLVISNGEREFQSSFSERAKERLFAKSSGPLESSSFRDLSSPLEVSVTCTGTELASTGTHQCELTLLLGIIFQGLPEELLDTRPLMDDAETATFINDPFSKASETLSEGKQRPRQLSLALNPPQVTLLTHRIHWPNGFEVSDAPRSGTIKIGDGYFRTTFRTDDNGVFIAEFEVSTGDRQLTPAEVHQWQSLYRDIVAENPDAEYQLKLTAVSSARKKLEVGSVKLAFRELQRRIEQEPDNVSHHIRLAENYADAGFHAMGRDVALKTMRQFPESAAACDSAAKIFLTTSSLERKAAHADHEQSVAFAKKAVALDPADFNYKFTLAAAMQTTASGFLADKATLLECAALVRTSESTLLPKGHGFVLQYLYSAGEYQEVVNYFDKYSPGHDLLHYKIAALCILEKLDVALLQLNKAPAPDVATIVVLTMQDLTLAREYARIPQFLTVVQDDFNLALSTSHLTIKMASQPRRYETVLQPETDPIGIVQRLIVNRLTKSDFFGSTDKYLHQAVTREESSCMDIVRIPGDTNDVTVLRAMDSTADAVSQILFTKSGTPASGFKVKARIFPSCEVDFFLASVDGKLKVLTTNQSIEALSEDALLFLNKGQLLQARQCVAWAAEELAGSIDSDNVFTGHPLARIWTKNDAMNANAYRVRYAAAMIAKPDKFPEAVNVLLDMRRRVRPPEQIQIDRAIVDFAWAGKRWKDGISAVDRLMRYQQGLDEYWRIKGRMLVHDRQFPQAIAFAESRLKANPEDYVAMKLKADAQIGQGRLDEAVKLKRLACENPQATYATYNEAAWTALLAGKHDERTYADAAVAARLCSFRDGHAMHTLACVCAEMGKVESALIALKSCIDMHPHKAAEADDEYVLGRVAEQMGMQDLANFYYDRIVSAGRVPEPDSAASLAVKRRSKLKTVSLQSSPN